MAAVSLDGQPVSSTRIREAILNGNLDDASQMLGRLYSLTGKVIPGKRLGHELGFPTANVETTGLALPPNGVYVVHVAQSNSAVNAVTAVDEKNSRYRAVLNIGTRPTLDEAVPQRSVEAHLLDFSGDLYGQELEITFLEKLRDEQKFADLAELKNQIRQDIKTAQSLF